MWAFLCAVAYQSELPDHIAPFELDWFFDEVDANRLALTIGHKIKHLALLFQSPRVSNRRGD
jgi:hypothetical protein